MTFEWADPPPPSSPDLRLTVRVEAQSEQGPATVLASAAAPFVRPIELELDAVPHGEARTVVAELVRRGTSDKVLYRGVSEPFDLLAGESVQVGVRLQLQRAPSFVASLRILGHQNGRVRSATVAVVAETVNGAELTLARDLALTTRRQTYTIEPDGEPLVYDMDLGLCDGPCPDGPRTIYARVAGAAGYTSTIASTSVELDRTPPAVVAAATFATPAVAAATATITVQLATSEQLAAAPRLTVSSTHGFGFERVHPQGEGASASFTFESTTAAATLPDGAYTVTAAGMQDLAGNRTGDVIVGTFSVDTVNPQVDRLDVDPSLVPFDPGAEIEIEIELTELELTPKVSVGDRRLSECVPDGTIWRCRYVVEGNEAPSNGVRTVSVVVDATDRAGNRGSTSRQLTFDFSPPAVVADSVSVALASTTARVPPRVAATSGTDVTIAFATDELLGAPPVVRTAGGPASIAFEYRAGAGTAWRYGALLQDALPYHGRHHVQVELVDLAGNVSTRTIAAFAVDAVAPQPVDVRTHGSVVLERQPWGTSTALGSPQFTLTSSRSAAEPGTTLLVLDRFDAELARATVAADGSFGPLNLMMADAPTVRLQLVDGAGNLSEIADVRDGVWFARISDGSPHQLELTPTAQTGTVRQGTGARRATATEASALSSPSDVAVLEVEGTAVWKLHEPSESPPGGSGYGMTYDLVRDRVVAFGGHDQPDVGTWEFDGARWSLRSPRVSPSPRRTRELVFDGRRGRSVLFGGRQSGTFLGDTWEWDGDEWTRTATTGPQPRARMEQSMSYDAARGEIVMFGGWAGGADVLDDLWVFDGEAWSVVTEGGDWPEVRTGAAQVHDSTRGVTVVFGGFTGGLPYLNDTWEWDRQRWTEVVTATVPPSRRKHAMAFDERNELTVMFGGWENPPSNGDEPQLLADTWTYDGANWSRVHTATTPPARMNQRMVYDRRRQRIVMFGGVGEEVGPFLREKRHDVWAFDGRNWSNITPNTEVPRGRTRTQFVFDRDAGQFVLHSGLYWSAGLDDTWTLDGERWSEVLRPAEPSRVAGVATYDPSRQRLLMFGGATGRGPSDHLLTWNGATWVDTPRSSPWPQPRSFHTQAFDEARGELVVIAGGGQVADAWAYDGNGWRALPDFPPGAAYNLRAAYDPLRQRVVVYGGRVWASATTTETIGETWEWDGSVWHERTATGPGPLEKHGLSWDPSRSRVVLFGGRSATNAAPSADVWEWDGTSWTLVPATPAIVGRHDHAQGYDYAEQRLVVFGGEDAIQTSAELWSLTTDRRQRPGVRLQVDWASAAVSRDDLEQVVLRCRVRGSGYGTATTPRTGATMSGADVLAWDVLAVRWVTLATTGADAATPAAITVTLSGDDARRLVRPDGRIDLLVRTVAARNDAPRPPRVVVDHFELEARYHRR